MNKLNIIAVHKNDNHAFERLITSVNQNIADVEITAITPDAKSIEGLKGFVDFNTVEYSGNGAVRAINEAISTLSSEFFMILFQDQIVDAEFFDTCFSDIEKNDFVLMNMSKKHHGWSFVKMYPDKKVSAESCLEIRPSIFCCVFNTQVVQKNQIKLKSFKISDQLSFVKASLEKAESPMYEPESHIYIDEISDSSEKSFISAFSDGKYTSTIIKASISDVVACIVKSKFYKKLGKLKGFIIRILRRTKRLIRRILKKVFRG